MKKNGHKLNMLSVFNKVLMAIIGVVDFEQNHRM